MEYIINYTDEGRIIGFMEGNTENNIVVDNQVWFKNQGMNKIIIDKNKNITFEKVDWRTAEEIEEERKQNIYSQISILESKTYRPLREQLVGTEEEKLQASTILGEIDEQIKALRSQLWKYI